MKRVRKEGSRKEETVRDGNECLVIENEAQKRWAEYFENLLNVEDDREPDERVREGAEYRCLEM